MACSVYNPEVVDAADLVSVVGAVGLDRTLTLRCCVVFLSLGFVVYPWCLCSSVRRIWSGLVRSVVLGSSVSVPLFSVVVRFWSSTSSFPHLSSLTHSLV